MDLEFPEELILKKNNEIINEVLSKKVLIQAEQFSLVEEYKENCSCISCTLNFKFNKAQKINIQGTGKGVIDALFAAILKEFAGSFISLQNVKLYDFLVKVRFNESSQRLQTDAPVEIKIVLESSTRKKMYFKCSSNSLVKAGICAICYAITYLINAELAVIQLHKDALLARKRQRLDLETKYTNQLVELVKFIPYMKVIENLSKEKKDVKYLQ